MSENEKSLESFAVQRSAHGEDFEINISVSVAYTKERMEAAGKRTEELLEELKRVLF